VLTLPPLGEIDKLLPNPLLELCDTSKPSGALTVTLPVRLLPLKVYLWELDVDPTSVSLKLRDDGLTLNSGGSAVPVPETLTFRVVAPEEEFDTLPLYDFASVGEKRTCIVVLTLPPLGEIDKLLPNPLLELCDTSKPSGALTVTLPVRLLPLKL